jgi:hypothetical protein
MTPEERSAWDLGLAEAMRNFEGRTNDMLGAMFLLERMKNDTIDHLDGLFVDQIRAKFPCLEEHEIFVLDKQESHALSYAIHHVGDLIRAFHRDYEAALEGRQP